MLNPALPALDVTGLLRAFVSRIAETSARSLDPRLQEVEDLQREFSLMAAEQIAVLEPAAQAAREQCDALAASPGAALDVVRLSEQLTTMRALRSQIVRPDPVRIERLARDGLQIAADWDGALAEYQVATDALIAALERALQERRAASVAAAGEPTFFAEDDPRLARASADVRVKYANTFRRLAE